MLWNKDGTEDTCFIDAVHADDGCFIQFRLMPLEVWLPYVVIHLQLLESCTIQDTINNICHRQGIATCLVVQHFTGSNYPAEWASYDGQML